VASQGQSIEDARTVKRTEAAIPILYSDERAVGQRRSASCIPSKSGHEGALQPLRPRSEILLDRCPLVESAYRPLRTGLPIVMANRKPCGIAMRLLYRGTDTHRINEADALGENLYSVQRHR
jgi:hypothetical protein